MSDLEGVKLAPWNLIATERQRQISVEGWTPAHDDEHRDGEMLRAAVVYIWHGTMMGPSFEGGLPLGWPWDAKWWKPRDRRSNLIRAGALCLAEHDRLVRAGKPTGPADHKLGIALRELSALSPSPVPAPLPGSGETKSNYPEIPDGWKLVPANKPTDQMYVAFREALDDHGHIYRFVEAYQAMVAASPANPAETQAVEVGK